MAGNKLGIMKATTGFGKKGYKPGAMIAKLNKKSKTLMKPKVKKIIKKSN